jgi:hypothetical protein
MLRRMALVRTNVSDELSASFIRMTRIGGRLLVTASVAPSSPILVTLMKEVLSSSETSVLTRAHGVESQKTPLFFCKSAFNTNSSQQGNIIEEMTTPQTTYLGASIHFTVLLTDVTTK